MKVYANPNLLNDQGKLLREAAYELERIRKEAEQQLDVLLQTWQSSDATALQEAFYAAGGLNEFSKRMTRGYLAFSDHLYDAARTYQSVSNGLAADETAAASKTWFD